MGNVALYDKQGTELTGKERNLRAILKQTGAWRRNQRPPPEASCVSGRSVSGRSRGTIVCVSRHSE